MYHLKTDYTDLGIMDFIGKALTIHEKLSDPLFSGVNPPLATLNGYITDANAAATADPVNVIVRNDALATLDTCLGLIGAWVENFCGNDVVKLQASGYDIIERQSIDPMPRPTGLVASTSGIPGISMVALKWKAIYGCRLFHVQRTPFPYTAESVWTECATPTKAKCEVEVTPGAWAFRIIAISSKGKSVPSLPASIVVG